MKYFTEDEFKQLSEKEQDKYLTNLSKMSQDLKNEARKIDDERNKLSDTDLKFIFIITPEQSKYLEWFAYERRMSKAEIVRGFIDYTMSTDKQYQDHLKKQT